MPTDIKCVLQRKATSEPQPSKDAFTSLTTIFFWAVVGLVLVTLLINSSMSPELVETMIIPG